MTPDQILVAHIVRALCLIAVVGLVARRRAHLCWSFLAYLVVVLSYNTLVTFWPDQFFKAWFWILGHGIFDALRMAIAFELAYRTFQAFPAANATARRLLFGVLVATSLALVGIPGTASSSVVLLEWQPRVLTGTIWLINGLAILITWYRVPVHAYHKALLLAFVPYLLIFTTLLSLIKQWGSGFFPYAQALEPIAFMVLVGFWAWSSWRDEPQPQASPALVRRLQPWRA